MKSFVKTALTISLLLPLAGCWDFGWSKKETKQGETGMQGHTHAGKQCSNPHCKHDHSKKNGVETQGRREDDEENFYEEENVEIQDFDDADDVEIQSEDEDDMDLE